MLGYKVALSYTKRVVITLEIPEDAITNMKRTNIAKAETAKYRTMKAKVIKIEDDDGKTYEEAVSFNYCKNTLTYKLDKELVCHDFDMNLEDVCSKGIHFFLSKSLAETYGLESIENGVLTSYWDNGVKSNEENFVNGVKHGMILSWYHNDVKKSEASYVNGIIEGTYTLWYENGFRQKKFTQTNGKRQGLFTHWYDNGNKREELTYVDDKQQGIVHGWYKNGKKHFEISMLDDKKNGESHYWDENAYKRTITFVHGERIGVYCCVIA